MIETTVQETIAAIHAAPQRLVLEFAGAGSLALAWLHSVAGSSRTILEATDRYSPGSLADLIGREPDKFVSRDTARAMADAAYRRARRLSDGDWPCLGVACTATIATDRVKRGDHGCAIAVRDTHGVRSATLTLAKGARDRGAEEQVVSRLLIGAIAAACAITPPHLGLLPADAYAERYEEAPDPIARLLAGAMPYVYVTADGQADADAAPPQALLSGSFNPLHAGHERLAQVAAALLQAPVVFELPVANADKPPLGYAEVERRLEQFRGRYPVILTRAPLFVEKAALFPGCTFVIGADTAARLVHPRYYGGDAARDAALARIAGHGCSFLVAGRLSDGAFQTLADIAVPPQFAELFRGIPEQLFRSDLSSSAIRDAYARDD